LSNFVFILLLVWIIFAHFLFLQTLQNVSLVDSNPFKFIHYYFCALCNMATFCVFGHSDLTVMVDDSKMMVVSKYFQCVMFVFIHVLYITLRTSRMIRIILFQVICTRFLQPFCKGDNGWLAMVVITLLVIAWLIIIKKQSLW
jgi:hypothetical protein